MYKRKKIKKFKSNENNLNETDENELSSHTLKMLHNAGMPTRILLQNKNL
jgi:hypothetical protein